MAGLRGRRGGGTADRPAVIRQLLRAVTDARRADRRRRRRRFPYKTCLRPPTISSLDTASPDPVQASGAALSGLRKQLTRDYALVAFFDLKVATTWCLIWVTR